MLAVIHNQLIRSPYWQKSIQHGHYTILEMSVKHASTEREQFPVMHSR
jgi:hypothetical protein